MSDGPLAPADATASSTHFCVVASSASWKHFKKSNHEKWSGVNIARPPSATHHDTPAGKAASTGGPKRRRTTGANLLRRTSETGKGESPDPVRHNVQRSTTGQVIFVNAGELVDGTRKAAEHGPGDQNKKPGVHFLVQLCTYKHK